MTFWDRVFFESPALPLQGFVIRAVVSYLWLLMMARLMGQRMLGRLTMFDLVVAIAVGQIAASPNTTPQFSLVVNMLGITVWSLMHIAISRLTTHFPSLRRVFAGEPIVVVRDGRVLERNMARAALTFDDLMEELRQRHVPKLADVEFAVFEPSGKISVVQKADRQPVTPKDLGLPVSQEGMPAIVVLRGRVLEKTLEEIGRTQEWLKAKLAEYGVDDVRDVVVAQVDTEGRLYIDLREDSTEKPKSTVKPETLATLRKAAADLQSFSLDTEDPGARAMYRDLAAKLEAMVHRLEPHLASGEKGPDPEGDGRQGEGNADGR
ncbi:MAG: DUF421 domain-containing protein [Clostridia bacterium]|nr:DUF421 domain-containing protein [Clostridia bacterium]